MSKDINLLFVENKILWLWKLRKDTISVKLCVHFLCLSSFEQNKYQKKRTGQEKKIICRKTLNFRATLKYIHRLRKGEVQRIDANYQFQGVYIFCSFV